MAVTKVTPEDIAGVLLSSGYSSTVAHAVEKALVNAKSKGYEKFYLLQSDRCLLCGSRDYSDLIIDVFLPTHEKNGYVYPICRTDLSEAEYVRGEDSEIINRIREETEFLSN